MQQHPHHVHSQRVIGGVDGEDGQMPQILPPVGGERQVSDHLRLRHRLIGHYIRDAMLVNSNQAERFWRKRVAQNLGNLRARLPAAARFCGQHQLPRRRIAGVRHRRVAARGLINRT